MPKYSLARGTRQKTRSMSKDTLYNDSINVSYHESYLNFTLRNSDSLGLWASTPKTRLFFVGGSARSPEGAAPERILCIGCAALAHTMHKIVREDVEHEGSLRVGGCAPTGGKAGLVFGIFACIVVIIPAVG